MPCAAQASKGAPLTDDIDRAQAREAELLGDALRNQARRAGLVGKTEADSAECCTSCGNDIPAQRRRAVPGCQWCVVCQARSERAGAAQRAQGAQGRYEY